MYITLPAGKEALGESAYAALRMYADAAHVGLFPKMPSFLRRDYAV